MGERIWFATSNWKDKPNKPSYCTQAQWDALNSSKFNAAPFASPMTIDSSTSTIKFKGPGFFTKLQSKIQAIANAENRTHGMCLQNSFIISSPQVPRIINDIVRAEEPKDGELDTYTPSSCKELEATVWDGSTYYDSQETTISRTFSWTYTRPDNPLTSNGNGGYNCSDQNRSITVDSKVAYKVPSSSTAAPLPVCGAGTHIVEISEDTAMKLIWRARKLSFDTSDFKATGKMTSSYSLGGCCSGTLNSNVDVTLGTEVQNLTPANQPNSTVPKESEILTLKWDSTSKTGFTNESLVPSPYCGSANPGTNPNNNIKYTVNETGSLTKNVIKDSYGNDKCGTTSDCDQGYRCAWNNTHNWFWKSYDFSYYDYNTGTYNQLPAQFQIPNAMDISLKPFSERHKYIYFINNKFYVDITGILNFNLSFNRLSYAIGNYTFKTISSETTPAGNININLFGTTYSVPVVKTLIKYPNLGLTGVNVLTLNKPTETLNNLTFSGAIKIKGESYYEYANSKGEAIYDQTSGAQLKDPLS